MVVIAKDRVDEKYSKKAENTAQQLREAIQAEIKAIGKHDWAGEYYYGDGMGVNVTLLLAPKSGYLFEWHGCLGVYDRNYGAVTYTNGKIQLSFAFKNVRKGFQGIAKEFVLIPWGDRRYLIPLDDIIGFCNHVNAGTEPRDYGHGSYLLRKTNLTKDAISLFQQFNQFLTNLFGKRNKKNVDNSPIVPKEFQKYLLEKPIEATIISVGKHTTRPSICEWKFKDTLVTVNAGRKAGLLPGMELHVFYPDNIVESVNLAKVEDDTATGIMTETDEKKPGPGIGWKLSTRYGWLR